MNKDIVTVIVLIGATLAIFAFNTAFRFSETEKEVAKLKKEVELLKTDFKDYIEIELKYLKGEK